MNDKHVVKMILESAQMLSTAHRILDEVCDTRFYKVAHKNHPCTIWARQTSGNYLWLFEHFKSLSEEYTYRYDKQHLTWNKLGKLLEKIPNNIPMGERTAFAIAMKNYPDCITEDAVESYRNYYKVAKRGLATWKNRPVPEWWE